MASLAFRREPRRAVFSRVLGTVNRQLARAYNRRHAQGTINQVQLAEKLGIDKSAVTRRLSGDANITLRSLADLIWALDQDLVFELRDRAGARDGDNAHDGAAVAPSTPQLFIKATAA